MNAAPVQALLALADALGFQCISMYWNDSPDQPLLWRVEDEESGIVAELVMAQLPQAAMQASQASSLAGAAPE